ncbi:MAG: hypothetical protein M1115_08060 [Actinobacteria bacterium]|nr:hypothetical protein [Actinomycetota bacterium]
MSAWIVSKAHIDAMVTAALSVGAPLDGLSWWRRHGLDLEAVCKEHGWEAYLAAIKDWRRCIDCGDIDRAHEVGMMLWGENLASIHSRYPDTARNDGDYPGPRGFSEMEVASYSYEPTRLLSPVELLKAIDCYEYQSNEHDGWKSSEARSFCEALRADAIRCLDGYEEAPWGLEEKDVRNKILAP